MGEDPSASGQPVDDSTDNGDNDGGGGGDDARPETGDVALILGEATIFPEAGGKQRLTAGHQLGLGDRNGAVVVVFADGSSYTLGPDSELKIVSEDLLRLLTGRLRLESRERASDTGATQRYPVAVTRKRHVQRVRVSSDAP